MGYVIISGVCVAAVLAFHQWTLYNKQHAIISMLQLTAQRLDADAALIRELAKTSDAQAGILQDLEARLDHLAEFINTTANHR